MTHESIHDDHLLLRRLHGELAPDQEARLDARLAAEPRLRRRLDAYEQVWDELEPPLDRPLPDDFATAIQIRAGRELTGWRWSAAPAWARAGMATALAAGIALGIGVGSLAPTAAGFTAPAIHSDTDSVSGWYAHDEGSLAEDFWLAVDAIDGTLPMANAPEVVP